MTMPSGADGLDPGAWMAEWVSQGADLSQLAGRTQDAISSYYQGQTLDSPSWQQAANNFFQNILGGFGSLGQFLELVVESITGTPGALTDLQAFIAQQWSSLADSLSWLTDIGVLVDTFFKFLTGTKTQADLDAAWLAVCTDFGITSPDWTGFWDGILANWVTPTGTFSPALWSKRLTNDLTILFDVFHLTYQAGSSGDAPGTLGTNGKATWYSAWNDLLALVGIVNSTAAPTVTAPTIGESIQANTAASSIAGTNAALAIATNQDLTNKIIASQTGVEPTAGTTTDAQNALENIPASNVQGQTGALVTWGATGPVASAGPGTYSGNNAGTVSFTPTSTDTSLDIVVTYYGAQSSTRTLTVTDSSGNPVPLVNKFAGNAYGGNVPEVAVFRASLTPTASPATLTFNINVASTDGNSYWSAVGISYYGIKVSYSAPFGGALSYSSGAGTTISMTRNSDNTKRLMMVLTWVGNAASTFSNLTAGASNRVPLSGSAAVYVSDIQGAPSGSTTTIGGKISSTNSGWSGSWAGLLVEMSN